MAIGKILGSTAGKIAGGTLIVAIPAATTVGFVYGIDNEKHGKTEVPAPTTYGDRRFDKLISDPSSTYAIDHTLHAPGGKVLSQLFRLDKKISLSQARKIVKQDGNRPADPVHTEPIDVHAANSSTELNKAFLKANININDKLAELNSANPNASYGVYTSADAVTRQINIQVYELAAQDAKFNALVDKVMGLIGDVGFYNLNLEKEHPDQVDNRGRHFYEVYGSQFRINPSEHNGWGNKIYWENYFQFGKQQAGSEYLQYRKPSNDLPQDTLQYTDFVDALGGKVHLTNDGVEVNADGSALADGATHPHFRALSSDENQVVNEFREFVDNDMVMNFVTTLDTTTNNIKYSFYFYKMGEESFQTLDDVLEGVQDPAGVVVRTFDKSTVDFGSTNKNGIPLNADGSYTEDIKNVIKDAFIGHEVIDPNGEMVYGVRYALGEWVPSSFEAYIK